MSQPKTFWSMVTEKIQKLEEISEKQFIIEDINQRKRKKVQSLQKMCKKECLKIRSSEINLSKHLPKKLCNEIEHEYKFLSKMYKKKICEKRNFLKRNLKDWEHMSMFW